MPGTRPISNTSSNDGPSMFGCSSARVGPAEPRRSDDPGYAEWTNQTLGSQYSP